ncbi:hypothetical protein IJ596_04775 [bacterium]|nr:hypothetical protein [bacterium]
MSTVEKINQLSHRIFNTTLNEKTVARSSNPFATSNFQKNILTEDVFESSKKDNNVSFTGNITSHTKRIYSTFVGSINDFGKKFYEGIETIKEFCNGVKNSVVAGWNKIVDFGNTEIHMGEGIKHGYEYVKNILGTDVTSMVNTRGREITRMSKMDPHTQVKPMLIDSIEALQAEIERTAA